MVYSICKGTSEQFSSSTSPMFASGPRRPATSLGRNRQARGARFWDFVCALACVAWVMVWVSRWSSPPKYVERVAVGELISDKSLERHFRFRQPSVLGLNL